MYNTDIQTTISVMGRIVFIEYKVSEEWAVEWWLNYGAYYLQPTPEQESGLALLDTLLRAQHSKQIESTLLDEFEARQYEMEQRLNAEFANEDIPF